MQVLKFIYRPKIVLMTGKNEIGDAIYSFLEQRQERLLHRFREADPVTSDIVRALNPDLIITCYWPFLLNKDIIEIPRLGCINFHPALLPRNRGWYPSVWEVLERGEHDAGVTLHMIEEKADTGPLLSQMSFPIGETDTGGDVYEKSREKMIFMFKEVWEMLYDFGVVLKKQKEEMATYHTKKETNELDEIDLEKDYKAGYLFNLIKAKTFGDKSYAYYRKDGVKYSLKLTVTKE